MAVVTLTRRSNLFVDEGAVYSIYVNNQNVGSVSRGGTLTFSVPAGSHVIYAMHSNGRTKSSVINFSASDNSAKNLEIWGDMSGLYISQ